MKRCHVPNSTAVQDSCPTPHPVSQQLPSLPGWGRLCEDALVQRARPLSIRLSRSVEASPYGCHWSSGEPPPPLNTLEVRGIPFEPGCSLPHQSPASHCACCSAAEALTRIALTLPFCPLTMLIKINAFFLISGRLGERTALFSHFSSLSQFFAGLKLNSLSTPPLPPFVYLSSGSLYDFIMFQQRIVV